MDFVFITYLKMETKIKEIKIDRYNKRYNQNYFDSQLKEIETLGVDEQYSLNVFNFRSEEEIKKIFETVFMKQKPNLKEMKLENIKLFANSFRLFTEKRWEKLNYIRFSKCSFIQIMLTSMINVPNFFQTVKYLLWNT